MKKQLKINTQIFETVFSFSITGTPIEITVPTPTQPTPTPPPTPNPLYPPFPPLSPYPPGTPLAPFPPVESPYYEPKPWGFYLLKRTISCYWYPGGNSAPVYDADGEQRYNEFKASVGTDPEDIRQVTAPFPTDYGVTYTALGRYPTTGPGIPSGVSDNITTVAWNPYYHVEYQDSNGLDMDYVWSQMPAWATWIPVIGKNQYWEVVLDNETPIVWG